MPTLNAIRARHWARLQRTRTTLDYHPMSNDTSECNAHAWRIFRRIHGERLTMAQARKG